MSTSTSLYHWPSAQLVVTSLYWRAQHLSAHDLHSLGPEQERCIPERAACFHCCASGTPSASAREVGTGSSPAAAPYSLAEALGVPKSEQWKQAVRSRMHPRNNRLRAQTFHA